MDIKNEPKHKYTNEDLKIMQNWDLDRKIEVSITRIMEFYSNFPHKIYILSVYSYYI